MGDVQLRVALISDVFFINRAEERLLHRLAEAKSMGADVALLPELALNEWCPYLRESRDADAEGPGGTREQIMSRVARESGIALMGGVIRRTESGRRFNTALVFDGSGTLVHEYAKVHLPHEDGFWETSHYLPGDAQAGVVEDFVISFGIQICSDINRSQGSQILAADGAQAIFNPRANSLGEYGRWKHVFVSTALTCCVYVLSVNRPRPEHGVGLGGPSVCVAPDGKIIVESTDPVVCVTLSAAEIARTKRRYPGYVDVRSDIYAREWDRVAARERDRMPPKT